MEAEIILKEAVSRLELAGVPDAAWDAAELMEWAGGPARSEWPLWEGELSGEVKSRFEEGVRLREQRVPLQHIIGKTCFMGLPFIVNEKVLCPRPDTELLAELVIDYVNKKHPEKAEILDLCCGSGCLGVSLAHFLPNANVTLSDISEEALKVCRMNAEANGLLSRCRIKKGDMFEALSGRFDLIVCNPPYIPETEIADLMPEVRDHEPKEALSGGGDGLDFYRILAEKAPAFSEVLFLEIGCEQAEAVKEIFSEAGWRTGKIYQDLAGLDRAAVIMR